MTGGNPPSAALLGEGGNVRQVMSVAGVVVASMAGDALKGALTTASQTNPCARRPSGNALTGAFRASDPPGRTVAPLGEQAGRGGSACCHR